MTSDQRKKLSEIKQFRQLIAYLRDEMGWPINSDSEFDELTYEYTTTELGIDEKSAAQIQEIKRLRPLSAKQPWGVFFVKFEPKKLPVVALRRILGQVALKKRASANPADRTMWAQEDLLFISNYGEGDDRQITLAHFSVPTGGHTLPSLKVLGWDSKDTVLHLEAVARELTEQLSWPADESDVDAWRNKWRAAFTVGHQEVITTSKALSIRLAQLARDIRDRISTALTIETDAGPLTKLMKAFQGSLIHDLTPDDFADMYAQTIAYGLLSSRIADPKKKSADDLAVHMRLSPFLKELMETFLQVGGRNKRASLDFDELGVGEVVDLLDNANMEAVVADFGDKNPQEDPVIHFYELFLKEYDEKKRMARGVFYTPRPVVSYIVRSTDDRLRTEFGLKDGLADITTWGELAKRNKNISIPLGVASDQAFVQILDPATGTGTFLVEAIDLIHKTVVQNWTSAGFSATKITELWNEYVPTHLLTRLYGYELLMAPYAIAHLKISLKLLETGYAFRSDMRANIYLTNSLEPPIDHSGRLAFAIPALAKEADSVNQVKANHHFTVIMGNPPYSHLSSNMSKETMTLVDEYKIIEGNRIAERGALSLQKNLQDDYIKFTRFAELAIKKSGSGIACLITNNSYLDGRSFRGMRWQLAQTFQNIWILDLHGSGKKDESTLTTSRDENVFDIMQGVAIGTWVRCGKSNGTSKILRSDLLGSRESKYETLLYPLGAIIWTSLDLLPPFYTLVKQDQAVLNEYQSYRSLREIFPIFSSGIKTHRDEFAFAFDVVEMRERLKRFCDPTVSDQEMRDQFGLKDTNIWSLAKKRAAANQEELLSSIAVAEYRPFDQRLTCFHKDVIELMRNTVMQQMVGNRNLALLSCQQQAEEGFHHVFCTRLISECCSVSNKTRETTSAFPLWISGQIQDKGGLFDISAPIQPNLASEWLGFNNSPEEVFNYIYAVLHSLGYRERYKSFLRSDFPRIPLLNTGSLFTQLADLGGRLSLCHLLEGDVQNKNPIRVIGLKQPVVEKVFWNRETVWIDKEQTIGFDGVGEAIWNFRIGGYQVCSKWLKDRKGRLLSDDDIAHYQKIVNAISETIIFMDRIDEAIELHGGWPGAFQTYRLES
jgi:predicted helicase